MVYQHLSEKNTVKAARQTDRQEKLGCMGQSGHNPIVTGRKKIPISLQDEYLVHMDSEKPEWDQTLILLP